MLGAGEYERAANRFALQDFGEDRWLRGAIDSCSTRSTVEATGVTAILAGLRNM